MIQDVGSPIQQMEHFPDRDEVLLVPFDGFIKNTSEGVIRTMLRNDELWIHKYPGLSAYKDLSTKELYDSTCIISPVDLLFNLSGTPMDNEELVIKKVEEIEHDLEMILPNVILNNSKITSFEYALYQLLQETNIKKCCIYRSTAFFDNEIDYIRKQYADVIDKIEIMSGGLYNLYDEVKPTTIFLDDWKEITNYFLKEIPTEQIQNTLFVVLNTIQNVVYDDTDETFNYQDEYTTEIEKINKEEIVGVSSMFNFAFDVSGLDLENDIEDDEPEDTESFEDEFISEEFDNLSNDDEL